MIAVVEPLFRGKSVLFHLIYATAQLEQLVELTP
jgi:hypothetical protein